MTLEHPLARSGSAACSRRRHRRLCQCDPVAGAARQAAACSSRRLCRHPRLQPQQQQEPQFPRPLQTPRHGRPLWLWVGCWPPSRQALAQPWLAPSAAERCRLAWTLMRAGMPRQRRRQQQQQQSAAIKAPREEGSRELCNKRKWPLCSLSAAPHSTNRVSGRATRHCCATAAPASFFFPLLLCFLPLFPGHSNPGQAACTTHLFLLAPVAPTLASYPHALLPRRRRRSRDRRGRAQHNMYVPCRVRGSLAHPTPPSLPFARGCVPGIL
jgi:hypothetical protein